MLSSAAITSPRPRAAGCAGALDDPDVAADLVLTDVVMPDITGNAFAAELQARRPDMKILFMSGYERPPDGSETWPGESLQVIGKPFSRAALLVTVSQLLGTGVRGPDPE